MLTRIPVTLQRNVPADQPDRRGRSDDRQGAGKRPCPPDWVMGSASDGSVRQYQGGSRVTAQASVGVLYA
ncbi:hypothetical protein GCM10022420_014720 [Streptomyces iranensis]